MRIRHVALAALLFASGCTHAQLQRSTLRQTATITDLRHLQVLDNLARVASNPGAMPYFAVIEDGTTQVQDQANPSGSLTFDPFGLTQEGLGLGGSRTIADQWNQDPIKDPDRLKAMQCAYLWALGHPSAGCPECVEPLKYFKVYDELAKIPPSWFRVGGKRDVPKDACYVGRCGGVYAWVPPEGRDGLTRFTLVIMDIATAAKEDLAPATQQVQERIYDEKGRLWKTITYSEERKVPAVASPSPTFQPKLRREERMFSPGLRFTPSVPLRTR